MEDGPSLCWVMRTRQDGSDIGKMYFSGSSDKMNADGGVGLEGMAVSEIILSNMYAV